MNTDATVVIGDEPLLSPPLISHTWSAIGMHDKFWAPVARKLRDGALVLVNDATFETELDEIRYRVLRVPATDVADELGNPLGGSMVMAGAYAATSGLVGLDALLEGMRASIPPYRAAAHRRERDRDPHRPRLGGRGMSVECREEQGDGHHRDRGVQGLRALHPRVPAGRADDEHARSTTSGTTTPSCSTGAPAARRACSICPDFVFEVFREVRDAGRERRA